jgi:hypothetical protein
VKNLGVVTAVDPQTGSFALYTRGGKELEFWVDEETKFNSRDGAIAGLEDIETEMVALVVSLPQRDGSLLATRVLVGPREDWPRFDLVARGEVVEIDEDSFSLETSAGEAHTFQVTDQTRFRSPGGTVQSLEDLVPGMRVLVGADGGEDGQMLAKLVLVGRPPKP